MISFKEIVEKKKMMSKDMEDDMDEKRRMFGKDEEEDDVDEKRRMFGKDEEEDDVDEDMEDKKKMIRKKKMMDDDMDDVMDDKKKMMDDKKENDDNERKERAKKEKIVEKSFSDFLRESKGDTAFHKYSENTLEELKLLLKHHKEDLIEAKAENPDEVSEIEKDIKEVEDAIKAKS